MPNPQTGRDPTRPREATLNPKVAGSIPGHSLGGMVAIELCARRPGSSAPSSPDDPGPIDPLPRTARIFEAFATQMAGAGGEAVRRAWVEDAAGSAASDA